MMGTSNRWSRYSAAALTAALALTFGACSGSTSHATSKSPATTAVKSTSGGGDAPPGAASALQDAFVTVLARVRPSVVEISTSEGLGSGVVYDAQGNIVTNAHVVGNASSFKVSLSDGRSFDATLVGVYAPDDLAVLKVSNGNLTPAPFADSAQVQVGDIALAIGNPLGLASSVTEGIVSATGRTVSEGGGVVLPSTIQTSAPINPGNSGGALVDLGGNVIGIPTLAATDPQLGGGAAPGIGFAIPANTVKSIADQLIATGKVTNSGRAALGIAGTTVMSRGQEVGVLVRTAASPADGAGIKAGDIVMAVDGKPTPSLDDLQTVLAGLAPGQKVSVDVTQANGTKHSASVTLGTL